MHVLGAVGLIGGLRAVDELGVNRELLAGGRAAEQVEENREILFARDHFFDANQRDVHWRWCHAEARVAFVGHEREAAGVGADEIRAGDAGLGEHVLFAKVDACAAGDRFRIVIVIGGDAFALESAGDFAAVFVNDRFDDVGWFVVVELDNELSEVGLEAFDAVLDEKRVEVDFLGGHRLRLCEAGDAVAAQDRKNFLARVFGGRGEVDLHAALGECRFRFREVIAEVVERVVLDRTGKFAQRIRIGIILVQDLVAFLRAFR